MAHLVTRLDVQEINHALLLLRSEISKSRNAGRTAATTITSESGSSGGGGSSATATPSQEVTLHLVATNQDGSIQVDADGYAKMETVKVLEPE